MKIPLSWLKEYVEIPQSEEECAELLSLSGLEVETIETCGEKLHHITTGKITKITPHPNADKLVICQVTDGKENHQIVTGATNVFEGAVVPVSLPGAVLADGTKIKESQLRGEDSNGMLCSEKELGISEEAQGIWILEENTPLGIDFIDYANLKDTIFEIGVLPNRGDTQSILGVARECSVLFNTELKQPDTTYKTSDLSNPFQLNNKLGKYCPLYTGTYLTVSKPTPSPFWMQRRLQACGIRPINILVDITNYVLLEYGQPLHSFDAATLTSKELVIRSANEGETFTTLDDQKRELKEDDILICDNNTPVALGGIMGGLNSEINENSTEIFLESAFFNPTQVRKTAFRLANRTESAMRFEKHVDIEAVTIARDRALHLYQSLCNGTISETQLISKDNDAFPNPSPLSYNPEKINNIIGTSFSDEEISNTLTALGFEINGSEITAPSWRRHDITTTACLAEEVARIIGFDKISAELPSELILTENPQTIHTIENTIKASLVHEGFSETLSFPMISETDCKNYQIETEGLWTIQNPLSQENAIMRPSLIPSLLMIANRNHKRQQTQIRLFESGNIYSKSENTPIETPFITCIALGKSTDHAWENQSEFTFHELKGIAYNALTAFNLPQLDEIISDKHYAHPRQQVTILCLKKPLVTIGTIHPMLASKYGFKEQVGFIEFHLENINSSPQKQKKYQAINPFPSTSRDIALLIPKDLSYQEIKKYLQKNKGKAVESFELFDHFESEQLGPNKKSIAISFVYRGKEGTLTDEEVNIAHEALSAKLTADLPVTIR